MDASPRLRQVTSHFLLIAGFILTLAGLILAYLGHVVLDARSFADRFASAIREPAVATALAEQISQAAIRSDPDLMPYQALIYYGSREIVASDAFSGIARRGAEGLHFVFVSESGQDLILNLSDVGTILESALPILPPDLAGRIPRDLTVRLSGDVESSGVFSRVLHITQTIAVFFRYSAWMVIAGVLCLVLATLANRRPWQVGRLTGWFLVGVAILMVITQVGAPVVTDLVFENQVRAAAGAAVLRVFLADMRTWALIVGGVGVVLLSASGSRTPSREDAVGWIETGWQWLTLRQESRAHTALRAALLIAAGIALTRWPATAIELIVALAGVLIIFLGLNALTTTFFQFHRARAEREAEAADTAAGERSNDGIGRWVWVVGLVVVLGAVGLLLWLRSGTTPLGRPLTIEQCNGHPGLCDRTLDQVVLPTTHNAMGSADIPNWFFPNQDAGIATQLEDGIRGFMIDAHYGYPVGNRVLTEIDDEGAARAKYNDVLGQEGVDAAFRIRARLVGQPMGERQVYLCHGFCEIGSTTLREGFEAMTHFLERNPHEVLIIVIQDEEVRAEDIAAVADDAGLSGFIYRGRMGPPWPTLRLMIEQKQQVLMFAENDAGSVPWYHQAFEVFQETPYDVRQSTAFVCSPNRGGTEGSLFQFNHWVTGVPAPQPRDAAVVNAYDFLMNRVRECVEERQKTPNLLAVDFYRTGDLFRVADELNGR